MLRDLRFAIHLMIKDRWYSAVAIVALALGIGLNATVFTLVNAILIRGLPYEDSPRLYMLGSQRQNGDRNSVSVADLQDWRTAVEGVRRPGAPSVTAASTSATTDPRRRMRAAPACRPTPSRCSPCVRSSAGTSRLTTSGPGRKA